LAGKECGRGPQKQNKKIPQSGAIPLISAPSALTIFNPFFRKSIQSIGDRGVLSKGKKCELRYIDQGYDLARATDTCAEGEDQPSDEQTGKSSQDESRDFYWGDI
jgi:hypothetical protein